MIRQDSGGNRKYLNVELHEAPETDVSGNSTKVWTDEVTDEGQSTRGR